MVFKKAKVAASFSRSAQDYAEHAVLQRTVADRLLERLELVNISPNLIVDVGSGPGGAARQLAKMYKSAQILQFDLSLSMLSQSRSQDPRFFSKQQYVCGDIELFPLRINSAELVFSSLMLQWCNDLDAAFIQIRSTLKKQGLFLFATLGPDTLKELRSSWAEVDNEVHVNTFIDMHDVGDALVRAGFVEPVMDVEHITLTYENCFALMKDLKTLGANNANVDRFKGLTGKNKFKSLESAYEKYRVEDRLPVTYEVVYGHAWIPLQELSSDGLTNEAYFPISSLKIRD